MNVRTEEIFIVIIVVPLYLRTLNIKCCSGLSGCSSLKPTTKSDQELCIEWWDKASGARSYSKTRADCLLPIQKKSPDMITISIIPSKSFQGSHELWGKNGIGTPSNRHEDLFFIVEEKKPVCFDDNGKVKDCDWWWGLAQDKNVKTRYRARCIDRIFHHCEYKIRITEESPCEAQGALVVKGVKLLHIATVEKQHQSPVDELRY